MEKNVERAAERYLDLVERFVLKGDMVSSCAVDEFTKRNPEVLDFVIGNYSPNDKSKRIANGREYATIIKYARRIAEKPGRIVWN